MMQSRNNIKEEKPLETIEVPFGDIMLLNAFIDSASIMSLEVTKLL
jgi:hypothetical protein